MADRLPSLELIFEVVRSERTAIAAHADSLDGKAGVLLGFAGVLVAVYPAGADLLLLAGRGLSILAAVLAAAALRPRSFPALGLQTLRDEYLQSEERFTRLRLLDTQIQLSRQDQDLIARKARFVSGAAVVLLCAGAVLVVASSMGMA